MKIPNIKCPSKEYLRKGNFRKERGEMDVVKGVNVSV